MAQQDFNTSFPNDGLGDKLRDAFLKQQSMNTELYSTKVDKVTGWDLSENNYSNTDKAKVDALTGEEQKNVQSDWNELDPASDAFILGKPIFSTSEIIVSADWTGTGLIFDVTADAFPINGVSYPATPAQVTLDAADGALDRIDLIVAIKPVDPLTVGTVGKITGTPASTALVVPPNFDPSLHYVIKQITVRAAATIPEGASNTQVYGDVTTWTKTLTANLTENTSDPSEGVNCIEATNSLTTDKANFLAPAPLSSGSIDMLTFDLKLKESAAGFLDLYFYLGSVLVKRYYIFSGSNGYDSANLSYQTIKILKSDLNIDLQNIDNFDLKLHADISGYYLDNVKIYTGSGAETVPETGIQDAPSDGVLRGRKNGAWEAIPASGAGASSLYNGTVIPLDNPLVTYCNMSSPSTVLTYTITGAVNGGKARLLVNAASLPAITGAINIKGDTFLANTDIYLELESSGGRIEYWVKQIATSPAVDLTALPFGKIVDASTVPATDFVGTPCILETTTGRFIASHDIYGSTAVKEGWGTILISDDLGQTFTKVLEVAGLFWGNLFEYDGKIYIIYTTGFSGSGNYTNADIAMRYSSDNGDTWSAETILFADDGSMLGYLTHSNPVLFRNGYVAMSVGKRKTITTFADSISAGILYGNLIDLTNAANWSLSSFLDFNSATYPITIGSNGAGYNRPKNSNLNKGHLESQIVYDGTNTYLHCRLEQSPNSNNGIFYIVTWDAGDPTASTISSTPNYHDFGGGHVKSQIVWDATSSKFWALVNWNRFKYFSDNRSELFLAYSSNFTDWTMCQKVGGRTLTINWETEIPAIGIQYPSFIIKGEDIYFVARTGTDSALNYHDADALTISKIANFRTPTEQTFVDGCLILDENSVRLEDGNGISIIHDQSKHQNSPYMLTADNASKVAWATGFDFTGSEFMRVLHNAKLNPETGTGLSFFCVVENLQSTAGLKIFSKSAGTGGLAAKDFSFTPQGMTIDSAYTTGYTDLTTANDYIFATTYDNVNNRIYNFLNGANRGNPATKVGMTWDTDHLNVTSAYTTGNVFNAYIGRREYAVSPLYFTSKIKALHIIPNYMTPAEVSAYTAALNAIYSIY